MQWATRMIYLKCTHISRQSYIDHNDHRSFSLLMSIDSSTHNDTTYQGGPLNHIRVKTKTSITV